MSKQLHRLVSAEWDDNQLDVHPVWETRTLTSIEQFEEWATTKKEAVPDELMSALPVSQRELTSKTL